MNLDRKKSGRTQRVLIIADTHGKVDSRLVDMARECDAIVHGGDIGGQHVLDCLRESSRPVYAVRGNNDTSERWAQAQELAALPWQLDLRLPGGALSIVHGHRHGSARSRHARLRQEFCHARAVVCGHSHRLVCDTGSHPWILNPGAAGRARTYGGPSAIILIATTDKWAATPVRVALREPKRCRLSACGVA